LAPNAALQCAACVGPDTAIVSSAFMDQLEAGLSGVLNAPARVLSAVLLAGGASKEAWAVDVATADGILELLVRRATGGATYAHMLSLEDEHRVLQVVFEAGVKTPRPYGYIADLAGHDAFAMERVLGETIGRRIVRRPEFASARDTLPRQMAEQLARIHSIPVQAVDFVPGPHSSPVASGYLDSLEEQLDSLPEAHPAIELGLRWLRDSPPPEHDIVLTHADFRLGNFVVDAQGIVAVLDWEYAHRGQPAEDLGWALVRSWRFGVDDRRVAGTGDVEPYLDRYNELTGLEIGCEELAWWELAGNVRWAIGAGRQGLRHLSGQERNVELAMLGRKAGEIEYEILNLLGQSG
jgi:aminoglycoside phosphotransferase (APT) family kinase protein